MPENAPRRIVIYVKDLCILTGKCERTCRKLMQKIRMAAKKSRQSPVTVKDICTFLQLDEQEVCRSLRL